MTPLSGVVLWGVNFLRSTSGGENCCRKKREVPYFCRYGRDCSFLRGDSSFFHLEKRTELQGFFFFLIQ